jgi:hypothetical protein
MPDDLKDRVLEIVSIAKECPDNLQPLCFELLLRDYLYGRRRPAAPPHAPQQQQAQTPPEQPADQQKDTAAGEKSTGQQDLKAADFHMKARKFIQKYALSMDLLNELFFKEGDEIKPLYEDLKTTRMAETQIRVALLHALLSAIKDGEFVADGEAVRAEVQQRKAYDKANFAANFKNNASLFEGFQSYEKASPLRLSEDGRKELAELIKELAQ